MSICISKPDYSARDKVIGQICQKYNFISRFSIGSSLCNRPIEALQIGNPQGSPILCGGFHGMEQLTILALLRFCNDFAEEFQQNPQHLSGITIIPCVNPDGTEIALHGSKAAKSYQPLVESVCKNTDNWQANARGVDLNHNFDADWQRLKQRELESGISSNSATRFGGMKPHSEPETQALVRFCNTIDFSFALALHSQGREIYYSFGKNTPKRCRELAKIFAKHSNYKIAQPPEIANGGGFKDWVIQKLKKPAITVEMGLGKNPLPLSDFEAEYRLLYPALRAIVAYNKNE